MGVVLSVEDVGPCRKQLKIEVPQPALQAETERVVKEYARQARIPGFRRGKVPAGMIRQRFRKEIEQEVVDRLLPRYKFHRDLASGRLLAQLMARAFAGCERPQALVPVPLHPARLRQRGYDQALELARPVATLLGLPLRAGLLQRVRATPAQSQLDAPARRRNLRGAFQAASQSLPAHVALVDDVMTTGATLHAAATALRKAGVARVDAWICARVP